MSKDKFTDDWPNEDGFYLFPEPMTDGVVAFHVNMRDGVAYRGNTPLEKYLEGEDCIAFMGPMSEEECKRKLRLFNG